MSQSGNQTWDPPAQGRPSLGRAEAGQGIVMLCDPSREIPDQDLRCEQTGKQKVNPVKSGFPQNI